MKPLFTSHGRVVIWTLTAVMFASSFVIAAVRKIVPDDAGPRDLVEAAEFINREQTSRIDPTVARSARVAVVAAATSTPLCTVRYTFEGPLPGGNVVLLLRSAGVVYESPAPDPKAKRVNAAWAKVPCSFDRKAARTGVRSEYVTSFNVEKCRCGKLANATCRKVTAGCK